MGSTEKLNSIFLVAVWRDRKRKLAEWVNGDQNEATQLFR